MRKLSFAIFILLFVAAGVYLTSQRPTRAADASALDNLPIVGSATVEGESTIIAAEVGGRVTAVNVDEGDAVSAGDVLVELDKSLLESQLGELNAAIATAKANLAAVKDTPQPEAVSVAQAELAQAQAQKDSAYQTWQAMLPLLDDPQDLDVPIRELQAQIKQAEGQVEQARASLKTAQIQEEAASRNQSSHAALVTYQVLQKQRAAAEVGVEMAQAQVQMLKVQLAHLWEQYNNPVALQVQAHKAEAGYHIAEAALALAQAQLNAVEAGPTDEEIAVAEAQVQLAESALGLVNAQVAQLTITAPRDGTISTRTIDPGELAVPGATLLKLTDLDNVTVRVFIPETQIGRVRLGQLARVTIDSVDDVFEGTVTFIANEAEFTPKNVQTKEERVNLVFAVEITVENPDHILKPGMPADAEILP